MEVVKSSFNNDDYVSLLEAKRYDEIIEKSYEFIQKKVHNYLHKFYHYQQYADDFLHEVYIHLLTKSLPSEAFLKACQEGTNFKFYLTRTIINIINTLLKREKNKSDNYTTIEDLLPKQDDGTSNAEKASFLKDQQYTQHNESSDLLEVLQEKMKIFFLNFSETFPKIAHKLQLLLKINARIVPNEADIRNCFPNINSKDIQSFWRGLGENEQQYAQKSEIELFQSIHPYFQKYRKERGSVEALQRWLNQHISGGKGQNGILQDLTFKENDTIFKITDKKVFADFLYNYFKTQGSNEPKLEAQQAVVLEEVVIDTKKVGVLKHSLAWVSKIFMIFPGF